VVVFSGAAGRAAVQDVRPAVGNSDLLGYSLAAVGADLDRDGTPDIAAGGVLRRRAGAGSTPERGAVLGGDRGEAAQAWPSGMRTFIETR